MAGRKPLDPEAISPMRNENDRKGCRNGLGQDGDTADEDEKIKNLEDAEMIMESGSLREENEEAAEGRSEDEEGEKPKTMRAPKGPTKQEREEHEALHLP